MPIVIPKDGRISQPNNSDLFGNIWATKNINFDEEGYIKLSSRTGAVLSEETDNNFDIPISFGRANNEFHIVTTDSPFDLNISEASFAIVEDTNTGNPTLTFDSWGKWFQNRWHASTTDGIKYTTGGNWSDTGVSLTSGKVHALEVFKNRNTLCAANGNVVKQYTTAYAASVDLTIPADFEVNCLAYNNSKMGVGTMLSDTAAGQNQEALFFTWDGASTSAGQGYGVGSDTIMGLVAYKSSWALLTRAGELKYFNGGGFDTLGSLPFYFQNTTWGDSQNRETHGDTLVVEGDVIYINVGNDLAVFGKNGESYMANYPGGVWCYDPKIGLYHRYSPSITPVYPIEVLTAGVNTTTNIITKNSGTLPATGNPIKYISSAASAIGGLTFGKIYYIIRHTSSTFSLAETKEDADAGNKVDLTSANDGSFMALDVIDYGAAKISRTGGMGIVESRKLTVDHMVFGAELADSNSTSDYGTVCMTLPHFENRGYFITAKIRTQEVEDLIQKLFIKYRPLDTYDEIIVKYRNEDVLGLPTGTPQYLSSVNCSWTDENTFTTTADLSAVKDYLDADSENECEVEVISGAGGGQMAQISSITYNAGTYTVNLAEDIDGAASGRVCNVLILNWKVLQTLDNEGSITSEDTEGHKEFPVLDNSKWIQFKVELRGDETTIEEFQAVPETQLASV